MLPFLGNARIVAGEKGAAFCSQSQPLNKRITAVIESTTCYVIGGNKQNSDEGGCLTMKIVVWFSRFVFTTGDHNVSCS